MKEQHKDVFWMLLRELEERVGNKPSPLDRELIVSAYKCASEMFGKDLKPEYIEETP